MARKRKLDYDSNGDLIKKKFHSKDIQKIQPLTDNQKRLFTSWEQDEELSFFLYGSAGTGKTFTAMYLALEDLLDEDSIYNEIVIIRSTVPSRDVGYLPGDVDEKTQAYEEPYMSICDELFRWKKSYENLKKINKIRFMPTSFLRGTTFDNCIIIVDEVQNMNIQELETVITRVGNNAKIFFCGDIRQSDLLYKKSDKSGFIEFKSVIEKMDDYFECIEFTRNDIVRSGLVKQYILTKEDLL